MEGILRRWRMREAADVLDRLRDYAAHRRAKALARQFFLERHGRETLRRWRAAAWLLPRLQAAVDLWAGNRLSGGWSSTGVRDTADFFHGSCCYT